MSERLTAEWYEAMAKATKKREHALAMVRRWEENVAEAEAEVDALTNPPTATETEQE